MGVFGGSRGGRTGELRGGDFGRTAALQLREAPHAGRGGAGEQLCAEHACSRVFVHVGGVSVRVNVWQRVLRCVRVSQHACWGTLRCLSVC